MGSTADGITGDEDARLTLGRRAIARIEAAIAALPEAERAAIRSLAAEAADREVTGFALSPAFNAGTGADIMALAFVVMMTTANDSRRDLQDVMNSTPTTSTRMLRGHGFPT